MQQILSNAGVYFDRDSRFGVATSISTAFNCNEERLLPVVELVKQLRTRDIPFTPWQEP